MGKAEINNRVQAVRRENLFYKSEMSFNFFHPCWEHQGEEQQNPLCLIPAERDLSKPSDLLPVFSESQVPPLQVRAALAGQHRVSRGSY